jgi:hypothetical protein
MPWLHGKALFFQPVKAGKNIPEKGVFGIILVRVSKGLYLIIIHGAHYHNQSKIERR